MRALPAFSLAAALACATAVAAPVSYDIDPHHTYPAFEADHFGGLSIWRGKLKSTSGRIVLDREARTGTVEVSMDMKSIDFGHEKMNEHAMSPDMFDVAKFPTATYRGRITKFNGDVPAEVEGELAMHGVTRPVKLAINSFKCMVNPMSMKDVCGADVSATLNREEFGVSYGKEFGFDMSVKLLISIEAIKAD
jgi:polyisoprenoid-binding protein YceI